MWQRLSNFACPWKLNTIELDTSVTDKHMSMRGHQNTLRLETGKWKKNHGQQQKKTPCPVAPKSCIDLCP